MTLAGHPARLGAAVGALIAGTCAGALSQAHAATAAQAPTACSALVGDRLHGVVVTQAEAVAAGPAPAPPGPPGAQATPQPMLPQHCLVRGVIDRRQGAGGRTYGIGFELRMPADWSGQFLFQGGGGLDGVISPAIGKVQGSAQPSALARRFAVVSTDAGHSGSPIDATFALDQQARVDYGYNALDKVTAAAKALIFDHYGQGPRYAYMVGCSNGGRQALTAAQRLPLAFDGIVAGHPAIRFSRVAIDQVWNLQVLARISPKDAQGRPIYAQAFSDQDLALVRSGVLKQCDARDGLADGMINDWRGCDFDPGVLMCKDAKSASCLSAGQVTALRDLHRGPRTKGGQSVYGPFNYDTGIASSQWRGMRLGTSQTGEANSADATLGLGQFKYLQLTPPEPARAADTPLDLEQSLQRVRHTAALADADSPFLTTFAGKGKMIVYNGLSDQGMASGVLVNWYEEMLAATGPAAKDAVSLFLVPGMLHCGGGEATDQFEMLDAIVDWVEKGRAPTQIVAASTRQPQVRRPLCPFPTVARYKGGDVNASSSFECRK